MNGTACGLFNLITERVGMLVVYSQMEEEECFEGMLVYSDRKKPTEGEFTK